MQQKLLADGVRIVSLVGKHAAGPTHWQREQARNGTVIGGFAACQDKAKRASLTVCAGVDFRRKAAA